MTAADISAQDDPGNLHTATSALLNRPVGGGGGGMRSTPVGAVTPRDYGAGFRAMGYSDPAGERPGQHQIQAGGRAPHGADVPPDGLAAPEAAGAGEAAAGGAEAAGAASGLAELAPLALAL